MAYGLDKTGYSRPMGGSLVEGCRRDIEGEIKSLRERGKRLEAMEAALADYIPREMDSEGMHALYGKIVLDSKENTDRILRLISEQEALMRQSEDKS